MGMRRKGREIALKVLYSLEYSESQENEKIQYFKEKLEELFPADEYENKEVIRDFSVSLLQIVIENADQIDAKIANHTANWSFDNLAKLDRAILQIATAELLFTETAPAIVINEAIEIAKKYSTEKSGKFINGILDTISKEIGKENEKIEV